MLLRSLHLAKPNSTIAWTACIVTLRAALGCGGDVIVGRAGELNAACPGCDAEAPAESGEECAEADAAARSDYDAWRTAPNQLELLAGTVWEGHIETGPDIQLRIAADETATLQVGEVLSSAPRAEQGYLCNQVRACTLAGFFEGATYTIHGARFASRRLEFVLNPYSPFDDWCQLQEPKASPTGSSNSCQRQLVWTAQFDFPCTADGEQVRCDWLEVARNLRPCACTSVGCVARAEWAQGSADVGPSGFRMDFTYSEQDGTLFGSALTYSECCPEDVVRAVRLWRVE